MNIRVRNPRFLLVKPPMQFSPDELIRPDGTLAVAYLDSALASAGFRSEILDMSVGTKADDLENTFYRKTVISPSLSRIGMTNERILEEVDAFDVIAVTSIFTQQTAQCFFISNLIKRHYPSKILIAGGCNARTLKQHFFENGFDVVFLSEAEKSIVDFACYLHSGSPPLSHIEGISFRNNDQVVVNPATTITTCLDDIPLPSWAKLPNEKYWSIGRIWGGRDGWIQGEEEPRYASIFTSRGCTFNCSYCHISEELDDDEAGSIGRFRAHSADRIMNELEELKRLGVKYLYINDDSFLTARKRVLPILDLFRKYSFLVADVNGINIAHLFRSRKGSMEVDEELLRSLFDAGFRKLSLPFESGNQRLIDKYASKKWQIARCDTADLIRKLNDIGMAADGNFMIGYPDETMEELTNTFMLARTLMDAGMVGCQFFIVQPFPGSRLFRQSLADGSLSPSWRWDDVGWSKGTLFNNMQIDAMTLKYCWSLVWKLLNRETRVEEFTMQKSERSTSSKLSGPLQPDIDRPR